jgi:hypothetical protein
MMEAGRTDASPSAEPVVAPTAASLPEWADKASKRVATAVMIAGAVIGMAIYWRPAPTHFEAFVAGGEVFRVNTKTGTVIACNGTRCMTVVQRGRRLVGSKEGRLFQGQASQPQLQQARPMPPSS